MAGLRAGTARDVAFMAVVSPGERSKPSGPHLEDSRAELLSGVRQVGAQALLGERRSRSVALARRLGREFRFDQPTWLQTDVLTALVRVAAGRSADGQRLGTQLLAGDDVLCLAITEPEAGSRLDALTCRLTERDGAAGIAGRKSAVSLGALADTALVVARDETGELVLAEVRTDAAGVDVEPLPLSGDYPSMAALTMEQAPAKVLSRGGTTLLALYRALSVERTFISLMLLEAASELLADGTASVRDADPDARAVARATTARMRAREIGARALVDRLVDGYVGGRSPSITDAAGARILAADLAIDAARHLVELSGTAGFLHGSGARPLDRLEIVTAHAFAGGSQRALLDVVVR